MFFSINFLNEFVESLINDNKLSEKPLENIQKTYINFNSVFNRIKNLE